MAVEIYIRFFVLLPNLSFFNLEHVNSPPPFSSSLEKYTRDEIPLTKTSLEKLERKSDVYRTEDSLGLPLPHNYALSEETQPDTNRKRRAAGDELLCRSSDGHYLPVELFALDTCARCYRYIPDHPSFFHRYGKWNHTIVTVRIGSVGFPYNVTYLTNLHENITASLFELYTLGFAFI